MLLSLCTTPHHDTILHITPYICLSIPAFNTGIAAVRSIYHSQSLTSDDLTILHFDGNKTITPHHVLHVYKFSFQNFIILVTLVSCII